MQHKNDIPIWRERNRETSVTSEESSGVEIIAIGI